MLTLTKEASILLFQFITGLLLYQLDIIPSFVLQFPRIMECTKMLKSRDMGPGGMGGLSYRHKLFFLLLLLGKVRGKHFLGIRIEMSFVLW